MAKKANNAKALAQQRRHRRRWLSFMRIVHYGVKNLSRNAWLTIAATAVMTVTLLILFMTAVAGNTLHDSIEEMKQKIDLSIYVKTETSEKDISRIKQNLEELSNTERVAYISPAEGRSALSQENKSDLTALSAITVANNKLPGTFRVTLRNVNDISELIKFTEENSAYKANQDRKPSFVTRRESIDKLTGWANFGQKAGLIASLIFTLISALIVFNTIRMAIFSRKEEIEMTKLVGADKSFIRGPFVVEAMAYGVIAGILASVIGGLAIYFAKDGLSNFGISIEPTLNILVTYSGFVLLVMVILGSIIGAVSSLLATRRYLKV